jgi:hydroxymethylbilane synthase
VIRIGTRGSALALWQANHVRDRLTQALGETVELEIIKTSGDKNTEQPLSQIGAAAGGKGLFVKEIEEALLDRRVHVAVHSAKDLPSTLAPGLAIAAYPEREDPRDALLTRGPASLKALPKGAKIGTSSLRRLAQLKSLRPDLEFLDLRGNVDTRVRKLDEGKYDAIVLAVAGLKRMGLGARITCVLDDLVPAVGQGSLAIETRAGEPILERVRGALDHPPTRFAVEAERGFLARLEGGCTIPVAAHATVAGSRVSLEALIGAPGGTKIVRGKSEGESAKAAEIGRALAEKLLAEGGREILDAIRS